MAFRSHRLAVSRRRDGFVVKKKEHEELIRMRDAEDRIVALFWDNAHPSKTAAVLLHALACGRHAWNLQEYLRRINSPQKVFRVYSDDLEELERSIARVPPGTRIDVAMIEAMENILGDLSPDCQALTMRKAASSVVAMSRHFLLLK